MILSLTFWEKSKIDRRPLRGSPNSVGFGLLQLVVLSFNLAPPPPPPTHAAKLPDAEAAGRRLEPDAL